MAELSETMEIDIAYGGSCAGGKREDRRRRPLANPDNVLRPLRRPFASG
jgi:hypothetical protein